MDLTGNTTIDVIIALGAILTAIGSFFKWLLPLYKKIIKKFAQEQGKNEFESGLKNWVKVADINEELRLHKKISRVVLLEITNGGDRPKPGSKLTASAINAKSDGVDGERSLEREATIMKRYENVVLDHGYIDILVKAQRDGVYKFETAKEIDCILKIFYNREGITYSEIYHIYTDGINNKMYILSVSTELAGEKFTSSLLRSYIEKGINEQRSVFQVGRK